MKHHHGPVFGFDIQQLAVALAPILAAELARVLPEVASRIAEDQGRAMSLSAARKMARCRITLVRSALESGALRGRRNEARWVITAGDVAAWIREGRPER